MNFSSIKSHWTYYSEFELLWNRNTDASLWPPRTHGIVGEQMGFLHVAAVFLNACLILRKSYKAIGTASRKAHANPLSGCLAVRMFSLFQEISPRSGWTGNFRVYTRQDLHSQRKKGRMQQNKKRENNNTNTHKSDRAWTKTWVNPGWLPHMRSVLNDKASSGRIYRILSPIFFFLHLIALVLF